MEPPTLEVDVLLQLDVLLRVVSSPRTCGTKKLVQEVQHFLLHDGGLLLGPFNFKSSLSRWYAALHSGRQSLIAVASIAKAL